MDSRLWQILPLVVLLACSGAALAQGPALVPEITSPKTVNVMPGDEFILSSSANCTGECGYTEATLESMKVVFTKLPHFTIFHILPFLAVFLGIAGYIIFRVERPRHHKGLVLLGMGLMVLAAFLTVVELRSAPQLPLELETNTPFYVVGKVTNYCGLMREGDVCNVYWKLKVAGTPGSSYDIVVKYRSLGQEVATQPVAVIILREVLLTGQ